MLCGRRWRTAPSRPVRAARDPRHDAGDQRADRAQGRADGAANHARVFATPSRSAASTATSCTTQSSTCPSRWCRASCVSTCRSASLADGSVLQPLDEAVVRRLVGELRDKGIEAVGRLLPQQSIAIPRTSSARRRSSPRWRPRFACRSRSEVVPEIREFERPRRHWSTSTFEPVSSITSRSCKQVGRDRLRRQLFRDAFQRWHRHARNRGALSGASARIGACGRRAGGGASRAAVRPSRFALVRHGRHHGQGFA